MQWYRRKFRVLLQETGGFLFSNWTYAIHSVNQGQFVHKFPSQYIIQFPVLQALLPHVLSSPSAFVCFVECLCLEFLSFFLPWQVIGLLPVVFTCLVLALEFVCLYPGVSVPLQSLVNCIVHSEPCFPTILIVLLMLIILQIYCTLALGTCDLTFVVDSSYDSYLCHST